MRSWSDLIERINIAPGHLTIVLDATAVAKHLALPIERLLPDALTINQPFQLRRRGVETKIILDNALPEVDQVLIRNIIKAMEWFEAIKSGETFTQIATRAGTSKRRVQDVIDLAFLAPDIIEKAVNGTLPLHFTSNYLIKTGIPVDWNMQRKMLTKPTFINARV